MNYILAAIAQSSSGPIVNRRNYNKKNWVLEPVSFQLSDDEWNEIFNSSSNTFIKKVLCDFLSLKQKSRFFQIVISYALTDTQEDPIGRCCSSVKVKIVQIFLNLRLEQ